MLPGPSDFDHGLPPILPGTLAGLVVATLLCVPAGRRLRCAPAHAWLLLASLGVILAVTLTPSQEALAVGVSGPITCDLSRIGPATWEVYRRFDDPVLNVLLFIPLGACLGALPGRSQRTVLMAGALALPWAIETTQALVVQLGRACQAGDVFDNSAGLLVGFVPVVLVASLLRRRTAD